MTTAATNPDAKALRDQITLVIKTRDSNTAGCTNLNGTQLYRGTLASGATGDPAVNAQVARDARATGVPVNSADDPDNCSFTLPALVRKGDIQITVSTAGRSPALAAWLKTRIEAVVHDTYVDLLDLLAETRAELQLVGRSTESPAWRRALDSGLPDLVAQGRIDEARALLHAQLALDDGAA